MKLVEILARELEVWPVEYRYFVQDHDGECKHGFAGTPVFNEYGIWLRDESSMNEVGFRSAEIACDFSDAIVTLPQWQAERDRMKAMETQQATASTEPTYEQQLWDRAAVAATQAFITAHITHFGHENVWQDKELVSCAADYADAFMAERAKRVGK